MTRILNTLLNVVILVLVADSVAFATTDVTLRDRAEIGSSVVRLGDVAEVVGADRQQARQLAALPLMPAPAPGTQRFLRKQEIADLLAAHGVDIREVRFAGAAQATIVAGDAAGQNRDDASGWVAGAPFNRHAAILAGHEIARSSTTLDPTRAADLRDELGKLIVGYLSLKAGQSAEWNVTCDASERHLALFDAATSPATCQGGSPPWTGRQRFVVSFTTADGAVQVPVYAEVAAASAPVVVAAQPIARGDVLTAAHFELRNVDYLPKPTDRRIAVDAVEKLVGMEARQAIQAGQIVFTDQVQSPVLVKRGDLISVSSNGSGIRIRTTARARQDGAHGQLVQVESLETRERYDARVVGPREAAILAISKSQPVEPDRINTARR